MAEFMFKMARERRIFWPVRFKVPLDDGQSREAVIYLRFHLLRRSDLASEEWRRVVAGQVGDQESMSMILSRIDDWKNVVGDDGQSVAFGQEGLQALIDELFITPASIARALIEASLGAPSKNSEPG